MPRHAMVLLLLAVIGCCGAARATDHAPSGVDDVAPRLNVLLILTDDLGHAIIDQPDKPAVPTPNLDRLRAGGVSFSTAYSTAPVCGPARAGLLTGQYQQRLGFEFNPDPRTHDAAEGAAIGLRVGVPTLATALSDAGYETALVGKWHLGQRPRQLPMRRGFDEFFGFLGGTCDYLPGHAQRNLFRGREKVQESEYLTSAFAREAVAFIARPREKPFFLYLAFNAIHEPARSPPGDERFAELADPAARDYARMIASLDEGVGRVLDALDASGQAERTIVIFMSDNGGAVDAGLWTNGGLSMGKQYLFEGGIRVPLLVRWPGVVPAGATIDAPVSGLDLAPTLLTACGATSPEGMRLDGIDLLPILTGAGNVPEQLSAIRQRLAERPLFWRTGPSDAIRVGSWKLIRSGQSIWLFDLATDPGEGTNLLQREPEQTAHLCGLLDAWDATLSDPDWGAGEIERVEILGQEYQRAL